MAEKKDRVLVIDQDDDERAMLVEAALEPFGYEVQAASEGGEGLKLIEDAPPDILILDLHLEELSGQDVLAAINARSLEIPVILLANQGAEKEALQAFRLGAKDYVVRPFREAELIQALERALKEVRLRRERETLVEEVRQAADVAKGHVQELRTLMSIGKSITSLRALDQVFEQVIRAAIKLTKAEATGFFLRDDRTGELVLRAGQNLQAELAKKMGDPVEDEVASLVMTSKETFVAAGEGLTRFNPAQTGATSVIYAPLMVHESAIGVLWVANEKALFAEHMKDLMTALADYAAIAVANARLLATMQERTRQLEQVAKQAPAPASGAKAGPDVRVDELVKRVRGPLTTIRTNMNMFRTGEMGRLMTSHQAAVDVMYRQLEDIIEILDSIAPAEK